MRQDIAKITGTSLGYEDHGILSCMLTVTYGGGACQGVGGFSLDTPYKDANGKHLGRVGTGYGMEFVARVMRACGVSSWEKINGRTIYVLQDGEPGESMLGSSRVLGIENLPTEPGERFIFAELADHFTDDGQHIAVSL